MAQADPGAGEIALSAVAGDGETGAVGMMLSTPLVVQATSNGLPVSQVEVTFAVVEGDARIVTAAVVTDEQGRASTQVILGAVPGAVRVSASTTGAQQPALFHVRAVLAPSLGDYALCFTGDFRHEVDVGLVAAGGDQYTVEAWARLDPEMLTRLSGTFVGQHAWYGDCKGTLDLICGHLRLSITTVSGAAGFHELQAPERLPPQQWIHVAGTYDGQYARLYESARLVASLPVSGLMTTHNERRSTRLGGYAGTATVDEWFSGTIDEVRIWSVARSAEQLRADMLHPIAPQSGLLGYWRFDEGIGGTTADVSGNEHTGTLTNYDGYGLPQWVPGVFTQIDTTAQW